MSTGENDSQIQEQLPEAKQILIKKLTKVFNPQIAIDIVCPKTYETRKHLTIEDLKHINYEKPDERLQRLRLMEHYQTTTQSLSRADLEASYQAFVRDQVGQQQYSRNELEQFVRNSADIDAAKRYADSANDISSIPLQPHLLFHSSKLNERKANLLKSANNNKSLKQISDNFNLHEYFPETLTTHSKSSHKQKEIFDKKKTYSLPRSMHVEYKDKKYHITFLKDSNHLQHHHKSSYHSTNNRNLLLMEQRNIDPLYGVDTSTVYGRSTASTSNVHHEAFPPLSLSALKEYRPTLTPKISSASTTRTQKQQQQRRKAMEKTDFIWGQSIVPPKHK